MAAKKMVSVALTMVLEVFSMGSLIVEQSFANPKLVFGGSSSPLASLLIRGILDQSRKPETPEPRRSLAKHAHGRYNACTEDDMPVLQVRDLPEEIYAELSYLAQKERRSLSQETIVILKEGIAAKLGNQERRKKLLQEESPLDIDGRKLPDPAVLIREDRER
jgi:antitoxin FitA